MKITFITNKYPNPVEENVLVFLQQLVWSMADKGIECTVICPVPVNINPKYIKFPYKTYEKTENWSEVTVYFPKYIGFGQSEILGYNPARITTNNFTRAIRRVMSTMNSKPDAVYGHFVTPAGIAAARIGKEFNIPSFLGYGEDSTRMIEHFGYEKAAKELEAITGVIAVSTKNKNDLLSVNAVDEEKIQVIPNGFRKERFYPRDKSESRKIFGLPEDKFLGKQVIAVPRLALYGEHIDDHQVQVASVLDKEGYLICVLDIKDLKSAIHYLKKNPINKKYNRPSEVVDIIINYINEN